MAGAADFCDNNLFYVDVLACVNIPERSCVLYFWII